MGVEKAPQHRGWRRRWTYYAVLSVLSLVVVSTGLIVRFGLGRASAALPPCSTLVGAGPCSLPPEPEPGCRATPGAVPKVKLQLEHGGHSTKTQTIYGTGFAATDANQKMELTGILSVPYIHYRDEIHVSVIACNMMAGSANFKPVVIPGDLSRPRQVPGTFQVVQIMDGRHLLVSHMYAVTEP